MPLELKGVVKPGQPDRRYYMMRVQVNGRRVVMSTATRDRKLAEQREQMVYNALCQDVTVSKADLMALIHGDHEARRRIAARSVNGMTLKEAFERCFLDVKGWLRIRAKATYKTNTEYVMKALGEDLPISQIDRDLMDEFARNELKKGFATGTIDRRLACVGKMLNLAVNEWKVLKYAPKMPYFNEKNRRKFVMSPEQEEALFKAVLEQQFIAPSSKGGRPRKNDGKEHVLLFITLIEGGMRLSEALNLRWEDIVYTSKGEGLLRFWRTEEIKNGEARTVPMTEACAKAIEARRGNPVGPFYGMTKRRAQHLWSRAKESVGIKQKDCVIHSLRHTCATRLLEVVGDIKLVQEWLGHTTVVTTSETYAHVQTRRLVSAAGALNKLRKRGTKNSLPKLS
jgi:integrase